MTGRFQLSFVKHLQVRLEKGIPAVSVAGVALHRRAIGLLQNKRGESLYSRRLHLGRILISLIHLGSY